MIRVLLAATLLALPANAETIVSPSEFQNMSEGKTLYFSRNGEYYGAEQYYTRRQSLWQFSNGECEHGRWFAQGDQICFVYEDSLEPVCWNFLQRDDGSFVARADGSDAAFDLLLERTDDEPLECKGPAIGA